MISCRFIAILQPGVRYLSIGGSKEVGVVQCRTQRMCSCRCSIFCATSTRALGGVLQGNALKRWQNDGSQRLVSLRVIREEVGDTRVRISRYPSRRLLGETRKGRFSRSLSWNIASSFPLILYQNTTRVLFETPSVFQVKKKNMC